MWVSQCLSRGSLRHTACNIILETNSLLKDTNINDIWTACLNCDGMSRFMPINRGLHKFPAVRVHGVVAPRSIILYQRPNSMTGIVWHTVPRVIWNYYCNEMPSDLNKCMTWYLNDFLDCNNCQLKTTKLINLGRVYNFVIVA